MNLFSNEKIITASEGNDITLTNYRLNYCYKGWGNSSYESIFLEDIALIKSVYKSRMLFLYVAGLLLLIAGYTSYISSGDIYGAGFGGRDNDAALISLVAAVVLVILWFISRVRIIAVFSSAGEAIELYVPTWNYEESTRFLDNVQLAKAQRVFGLYKEEVGA